MGWVWASWLAASIAPCDRQAAVFEAQVRPRPERAPRRWWAAADACPRRSLRDGSPAEGEVHCIDARGRWQGRESLFTDGVVFRQSRWDRDLEVGPRFEWDAGQVTERTELWRGALDGERAWWAEDGGVRVETWLRGVRHGPTWELGPDGRVLRIEHWDHDARAGIWCLREEGGLVAHPG
jgi:hypothetical protein